MEKYSETFPLRITTKMYKQIKIAAEREYLSISQYIRKALHDNLKAQEKAK